MSDDSRRSLLVLLTSHWVSMLGVALVTTAGFSWLFVLPIQLRGYTSNPYIGTVVFLVIPIIFIFGLVLIALGVFLARRRIERAEQALLATADRRTVIRMSVKRTSIAISSSSSLKTILYAVDEDLGTRTCQCGRFRLTKCDHVIITRMPCEIEIIRR